MEKQENLIEEEKNIKKKIILVVVTEIIIKHILVQHTNMISCVAGSLLYFLI